MACDCEVCTGGKPDSYDAWAQGWGTDAHLAPTGNPETDDCRLDPGVYEIVWGLWEAGIRTAWSCQGGGTANGHAFLHRMVAVGLGDEAAGPRALEIARNLDMPVWYLVRRQSASTQLGSTIFWWELEFDRETDWRRPAPEPPHG